MTTETMTVALKDIRQGFDRVAGEESEREICIGETSPGATPRYYGSLFLIFRLPKSRLRVLNRP